MMKKTISMMMATAVAVLLSCCTSDELPIADATDSVSEGASVVTFTAGVGTTTRADEESSEIQTSEEKQVTSLYAVLFSTSGSGTNGSTYTVDDNDTFYKYISVDDISDSSELSSTTSYSITIDESGTYALCFVANPSTTLVGEWDELTTSSTYSDFSALVVSDDPSTTPMLMVSENFYYISGSATLTSVALKRIMARIDIVNAGEGLVITKAVMKNRAVKSTLINDNNSTSTNSEYIESEEKTYDFSTDDQTSASSTDAVTVSSSEIYSYEQFETGDNAPVITLTYTLNDKTGTKDVSFADYTIERNNYYLINVSVEEETTSLELTISVADWDSDITSFEVSSETIDESGLAGAAVGDFIMNDGTLLASTEVESKTSSFSESYYPIAVVFYAVGENNLEPRFGSATYEKLGGVVHGKALALKNMGSAINWAEGTYANQATSVLTDCSTVATAYADYDGYANQQAILGIELTTSGDAFPAFEKASSFEPSAPEGTTDWYLPAAGEWYDIIENLASYSLSEYYTDSKATTSSNGYAYYSISNAGTTIATNLNNAMSSVGESYYDSFTAGSGEYYITSSESGTSYCRNVGFKSKNDALNIEAWTKNAGESTMYTRYVFAF